MERGLLPTTVAPAKCSLQERQRAPKPEDGESERRVTREKRREAESLAATARFPRAQPARRRVTSETLVTAPKRARARRTAERIARRKPSADWR